MRILLDFALRPGLTLRRCFSEPVAILRADTLDQIPSLLLELDQARTRGLHGVGFLSYESAPAFEPAARVQRPDPFFPLALFGLYRHPEPGCVAAPSPPPVTADWRPEWDFDDYRQRVGDLKRAIARGEIYQANLTLRHRSQLLAGTPLALYERLRRVQGADYCAYLETDRFALLSLSPELFFARQGSTLVTRPMKGTASTEDTASALLSEKNRAENLMIVDLLRNDLSRIAQPGTVQVPALFSPEAYPTLWQMTSTIKAEVAPEIPIGNLFQALFPCGSITGAPKIKAMEWIARLESGPRGVYCGTLGWVAPGGDAIFNVAIRTLYHDRSSQELVCGIGGGIVWDSESADEWAEIATKSRFLTAIDKTDGLLETLRMDAGNVVLRDPHFERLQRSARTLHYQDPDRASYDELLDHFASRYPEGSYRLRLQYPPSGRYHLEGFPIHGAPVQPVRVALAQRPVCSRNPWLKHKTLDRSRYEGHWIDQQPGLFDVLLWNERGELTEFTRANLVVERDGEWLTPALSCGLLPGTQRQWLLDQGVIRESVILKSDLDTATGLWFVNSVRGWVGVRVDPGA